MTVLPPDISPNDQRVAPPREPAQLSSGRGTAAIALAVLALLLFLAHYRSMRQASQQIAPQGVVQKKLAQPRATPSASQPWPSTRDPLLAAGIISLQRGDLAASPL